MIVQVEYKQYRWANGSHHKADPQKAGEVIADIADKNDGVVRVEDVVDAARDKDSPLHVEFEWDDKKAAEEHRQNKGRELLRHLVTIERRPDIQEDAEFPQEGPVAVYEVRGFVKESKDDELPDLPGAVSGSYVRIDDVMSDPARRKAFLRTALRELETWCARYSDLKEFAELFALVDRLEEKFQ